MRAAIRDCHLRARGSRKNRRDKSEREEQLLKSCKVPYESAKGNAF